MKDWQEAETRIERAQQLSDMHRWPEALDELEAALEINPNDATWHIQRGHILDQLDRHEEAVEAYQAALELTAGTPELQTALAIDLIRTGRHAEAVSRLEHLALEHPDYEPAYCNRIAAYTRLGDHDMAEQMFYEAQNITEECPNCFHHVAESLACRGLFDRAIYCWQRTLEIAPDYPLARQRIAEAYWMLSQHEKAREYYLAAMRADPGDTNLLAEFGDLLVEMDDLAGAAAKFRHALDLDPEATRSKVMLGLLCSQQDDLEAAVRYMESALTDDQHYPGLRAQLGEAELRRGNLYVALRHLSLGVEDEPDNAMAQMALGNCLLHLGRPAEAMPHFERMIELDGELAGPHHNLGICCFLQSDFENGIRHCLEALRIEPENVAVLHKLALAYLHLGRWREAAEMRDRGLTVDADHEGLKAMPRTFYRALSQALRPPVGLVASPSATLIHRTGRVWVYLGVSLHAAHEAQPPSAGYLGVRNTVQGDCATFRCRTLQPKTNRRSHFPTTVVATNIKSYCAGGTSWSMGRPQPERAPFV